MTQEKYCICENISTPGERSERSFSQIQYFFCVINHI